MTWAPVSMTSPAGSVPAAAGLAVELLSPWTPGVREGSGIYSWLSFPNAVAALDKLLAKHPDKALFVLAMSAGSFQALADVCAAMAGVFPLKQLQAWQKQAALRVSLEQDKLILMDPVVTGESMALQAVPTVQARLKKQLSQQAKAQAAGLSGTDPLSSLSSFESAKNSFNADVDAPLPALTGGKGWRFYAETDIAAKLQHGHPDHSHTLTVMIAWFGAPAALSYLRDMMPET